MKIKKNFTTFLVNFLIIIILIFFSMKSIANTLQFATIDFAPFMYEENEQLKGLHITVAKKVFKNINQKVSISIVPLARALQETKDGRFDGIVSAAKNPEREEYLDYIPTPLLDHSDLSFFIRSESNIKFNDDFKNLTPFTIGMVRKGDYGHRFAEALNNKIISIEECNSYEKCILKLSKNRTKVIVMNEIAFKFIVNRLKLKNSDFKKLTPRVASHSLYIALTKKKNLSALKEKLNIALKEYKDTEEYKSMLRKLK